MSYYDESLTISIGNVSKTVFKELLCNVKETPLSFLADAVWEDDDMWEKDWGWTLELSSDNGLTDLFELDEINKPLKELAKQVFVQAPDVVLFITYHAESYADGSGFHTEYYTTTDRTLEGFEAATDFFYLTCDECGSDLALADCLGDGTVCCDECNETISFADAIIAEGGVFKRINYKLLDSGELVEIACDEANDDWDDENEDWDDEE